MTNSQTKKFTPMLIVFIVIWALYTVLYGVLKNNPLTANFYGLMPLISLSILDLAAIIYAINLWKKSTDVDSRMIFILFALAFLFSFADDILYNLNANILHIPKGSSAWVSVFDNLVFIGDLLFLSIVWLKVFSSFRKQSKNSKTYATLAWILTAVLLIWSIVTQWHDQAIADKIFSVTEVFLCFVGFVFALFCLFTAKNRGLFYTSLAFSIGRISDFIFNYGIGSQQYAIGSMLETSWIVVLLLYVYGLSQFKTERTYLDEPLKWVTK